MSPRKVLFAVSVVLTGIVLVACQLTAKNPPPPTSAATAMPVPTDTPSPTSTPEPTATRTPKPTSTPMRAPQATATTIPAPASTKPAAPPAPPAATSAPAPSTTSSSTLNQAMTTTKKRLESFGGTIDVALGRGSIDCKEVVTGYDAIVGSPSYDVSGSEARVQNAYNSYRRAIEIFIGGAESMTENCRKFLADPSSSGGIPPIQWSTARLKVNEALDVLNPAIASLQ